jgi:hypothetical protein
MTRGLVALGAAAALIAGGGATSWLESLAWSPLLSGYSGRLAEGGRGDVLELRYVNRRAAWNAYDKLLLDPVQLWLPAPSGLSQADAQRMANNFYRSLSAALAPDYELVHEPRPHTIRVQVALASIESVDAPRNLVTTSVPQLRLITGPEGYVAHEPLFTVPLAVSGKVTDAESGELVWAAHGRRAGEALPFESPSSWPAVDGAFRYWAELLRHRFCELRGGTSCTEPAETRSFAPTAPGTAGSAAPSAAATTRG